MYLQAKFISDVKFPPRPIKFVNSGYSQYQSCKKITNLLAVSKLTEKGLQSSQLPPLYLWYELQNISLSDVTFPMWPGKSVNPNFWQYQSDRNNDKFTCCLESQSKMTARISIFTLNSLKLPSSQIQIWCRFPVVVF